MKDTRIAFAFSCAQCESLEQIAYEKEAWLRFMEIGKITFKCSFCDNSATVRMTDEFKAGLRERLER